MATEGLTLSFDNSAMMEFLASAQKLLETASRKKAEAFAAEVETLITVDQFIDVDPGKVMGEVQAIPTTAAIECLRKHGAY